MDRASITAVVVALIGTAALAAAAFVTAGFGGSAAVFATAVLETAGVCNGALFLLGARGHDGPTDDGLQVSRGREVFFWGSVVPILPFGVAAGLALSRGFEALREQQGLGYAGWAYLVLAAGLLFHLGTGLLGWRDLRATGAGSLPLAALRQADDPLPFASAATIAGLVVALLGVFCTDRLGWLWADGAAVLGIGAVMGLAALLPVIETHRLLVGAAVRPQLVEEIIGMAGRATFVQGVNEVRTMQLGPSEVLVNLSVDARDDISAASIEAGVLALEADIKGRHPEIGSVFVEIRSAEVGPPDGALASA